MKPAEIELDLLHAALEGARFGLAVTAPDGRILLINQSFCEILGRNQEDLVGGLYMDLFTAFGANKDFHELFRVGEAEVTSQLVRQTSAQSGLVRHVLLKASDVTANRSSYRVVSAFDVTSFGLTQEHYHALRRQLDALGHAVVTADPNQPDMPVTYVNQAFETITGYSRQEAIGRNCRFLQGKDTDAAAVDRLRRDIAEQRSSHVVLRNYLKDGTTFLNELFISPVFDEQGSLSQYIGIQRVVEND